MNQRRGSGNARNPSADTGGLLHPPHRGVRFVPDEVEEIRPWESVFGVLTACLATWCVVGLLTILVVLYVTVRPFSKVTYRRLAAAWGGAAFLDAIALLLPNCRVYLTGDSDIPSPVGSSILVANHVVTADWWALFLLGRCVGLRGSLKVFMRNEFLHINMENVDIATINSTLRPNGSSSNLITSAASGSNGHNGSLTHNASPTSTPSHSASGAHDSQPAAPDLALMAKLLHLFLEFPLVNGEDNATDREQLFTMLRSFAAAGTRSPVHLLFYPECWSMHNGADRKSTHAKSNEFAKREGKPALTHLLLPRTRGFNASLECLRESSPVVYDITMAYKGYDGSLPPAMDLSMTTLWDLLRRKFPKEVHLRIKRYSMEEVLQDSNWLSKKWAEKDRILSHFARHQVFPTDNRGYCQHRVFDTRSFSLESSIVALIRLLLLPCAVPVLLLLSVPLFWTLLSIWLGQRAYNLIFQVPSETTNPDDNRPGSLGGTGQRTPGSASAAGTPFFPATPFASPTLQNWRDMFSPNNTTTNGTR